MQTYLTDSPNKAAEFIRDGGVVAFPTETVYGLGADVFNESAIKRIFEAKNRPSDNPLIAHIGDLEQLGRLASTFTRHAQRLIDAFFPGPLTIVLPRSADVPDSATAGLATIGIRMPRHEVAREFLKACGSKQLHVVAGIPAQGTLPQHARTTYVRNLQWVADEAAEPLDFEAWVTEKADALLRFAYVLTGDANLAEDAVQDALTTACARWPISSCACALTGNNAPRVAWRCW